MTSKLTGSDMLCALHAMDAANYPNHSRFLRARLRRCGYYIEKPDGKRKYDYDGFELALQSALESCASQSSMAEIVEDLRTQNIHYSKRVRDQLKGVGIEYRTYRVSKP